MRNVGLDNKEMYGDDDIDRKSSLKRLFFLVKPHLWKLTIVFVITLLTTGVTMLIPKVTEDLIDNSIQELSLSRLNQMSLGLLGLILVSAVLRFLSNYWVGHISAVFLRQLRELLFHHMLGLSLNFFQKRQSGELNARIMTNLQFIQRMLTNSLFSGIQSILTLLGAVALLFYTNIKLTTVALLVCIPMILVSMLYTRWVEKAALNVNDNLATSSANVEEVINGISTVQSFGNEPREFSRYQQLMKNLMRAQLLEIKHVSTYEALLHVLGFSAIVVVIWFGGQQILNGELSMGNLTACLMYMTMFAMSFGDIGGLMTNIGELSAVSHRIFQILDEQPMVKEKGKRDIDKNTPLNIEFSEVSFSYPPYTGQQAIDQFSLSIKEGDELAIVGPSGAGKTTLFKLLLRFYEPDTGKILLNGNDLSSYKLHSLRHAVGLVSQDIFLFSGTVLDNIRYGNLEASIQDVKEALEAIGATNFVYSLQNGLNEQVGVGGSRLSGGQKQLLGIARVYLKNPGILLLDEATSSLDSESEERVQNSLKKLKVNRTSITIAHRMSTVRDANYIMLLKAGKLIAAGSHEDLLVNSDLYKKYWYWQSCGIEAIDLDFPNRNFL